MAREDAYRIVQSAALRALDGDGGFRTNLEAEAEVRSRIGDRLDTIFDPSDLLVHVDLAFERLNLGVKVT
jgi:adenylosuccinate lyase